MGGFQKVNSNPHLGFFEIIKNHQKSWFFVDSHRFVWICTLMRDTRSIDNSWQVVKSFNLPCEPPGKIKPSWKKARARHFYLQKIFRAHRDCAQNIIDFRWKIRMQDEKVGGGHIVYCTGSKPPKADWKSKIMRVASESGSTYLDLAPRSATWSRTWTGDVFC